MEIIFDKVLVNFVKILFRLLFGEGNLLGLEIIDLFYGGLGILKNNEIVVGRIEDKI